VGLLPHLGQVVVAHVPRRVAVHVGERAGETFAEIGETSSVVLAGAIARFQTAGIRAAACTAERDGGVAAALARIANDQDADVIVLGARRPGGWESLVAGSTLHEVLRLGDRPVLVAGRRQHVASATGT
ncbi:MAG TPA: universal stress protein, partial [Candidatus Dormibacteraeota bacterium]|nr:universal stress protein [Candidatus Dormibacteraeota bacterium]